MNDLTGLYDDGTDLDSRLEQASYILKEAAEQEGVDLNQLSDEDVSGMLADIVNDDSGEGGESEEKTAGDITVADVSLELTKRAAAEGFDLTQLHPDDYEELFNKVAEELVDPEYAEEAQKLAQDEARMEHLGRIAARGFADEIDKLAADDEDDEDEIDVKVKKAAYMLKEAGWAGDTFRAAKGKVQHGFGLAKGKARDLKNRASEGVKSKRKGLANKYEGHLNESGGREIMRQSGGSREGAFGKGVDASERRLVGKAKERGRVVGGAVGAGVGTAAGAGGMYAAGDHRRRR
jgi:hypothetical protein